MSPPPRAAAPIRPEAARAGAAPPLPVWPVVAATTATQSLSTLAALALTAVAPRAARDLGTDPALIGYQVSLVYVGAMLMSLVSGGLVRRLGAARTSQVALWMAAGGCLLSALGVLPVLALGAFVIGIGYGCTNPAASQLLARTPTTGRMNLIFSIKQTGVPIGGILAGLMVPSITLAFGWQAALVVCAVLAIGLGLTIERVRPAWDGDRDPSSPLLAEPLASLALIWRQPVLRWLALASLAYAAAQLILVGFLVTYLVTEIGLDLVVAGTVLALAQTAGAGGRLVWGWLADRLRSATMALIVNGSLASAGALATAAIAAGWPLWAIVAAASFYGFSVIGWNGVFMAAVARHSPPERIGVATGGALSITYAGIIVGPSAFAALHDRMQMSYGEGFVLLALVTALGVACVFSARRHAPG
jgi:MFS family permease